MLNLKSISNFAVGGKEIFKTAKNGGIIFTFYQHKDFSDYGIQGAGSMYFDSIVDWTSVNSGTDVVVYKQANKASQRYSYNKEHRRNTAAARLARAYVAENAKEATLDISSVGSTNGGVKKVVNLDLSNSDFVKFVFSSSTASNVGKLILRTSVGNEVALNFTASSTANEPTTKTFSIKVNDGVDVVYTGTPNLSAITEIEITNNVANRTTNAKALYWAKEQYQLPAEILTIQHRCIDSYGVEQNFENNDQFCGYVTRGKVGTGRKPTITLKSTNTNNFISAVSNGFISQKQTMLVSKKIDGDYTVANNQITLNAGTILDRVVVNTDYPMNVVTGGVATSTSVKYEVSTGVITFEANTYNGYSTKNTGTGSLTLYKLEDTEVIGYSVRGVDIGYTGELDVAMSDGGITDNMRGVKAQLMPNAFEQGDATNNYEFTYELLAGANGEYFTNYIY